MIMQDSRSCSEFIRQINDPRSLVNCGSCKLWMPLEQRCRDEVRVLRSGKIESEDRSFRDMDYMMRMNRPVFIAP